MKRLSFLFKAMLWMLLFLLYTQNISMVNTHFSCQYLNAIVRLPKVVNHARQRIKLSGLGLPAFDKATQALLAIHTYFASHIPTSTLTDFQPLVYHGDIAIECSNRYFTLKEEIRVGEELPLTDIIDPCNILRSGQVDGHYTSDNEVLYFQRREQEKEDG